MPNDDMSGSEDGQLRSPDGDDHIMLRYVYSNHFVLMDDCCLTKKQNKKSHCK